MVFDIGLGRLSTLLCMLGLLIGGAGLIAEAQSTGAAGNDTANFDPVACCPPDAAPPSGDDGTAARVPGPADAGTMPPANGETISENGAGTARASALAGLDTVGGVDPGELLESMLEALGKTMRNDGIGGAEDVLEAGGNAQ